MWSSNKNIDKLYLWVTDMSDKNVLTSGFVDMFASPMGKTRPRGAVFEVKKRG
jgi:enamine deaminase RidA (YjgF/YER057c/UK114 family)